MTWERIENMTREELVAEVKSIALSVAWTWEEAKEMQRLGEEAIENGDPDKGVMLLNEGRAWETALTFACLKRFNPDGKVE